MPISPAQTLLLRALLTGKSLRTQYIMSIGPVASCTRGVGECGGPSVNLNMFKALRRKGFLSFQLQGTGNDGHAKYYIISEKGREAIRQIA